MLEMCVESVGYSRVLFTVFRRRTWTFFDTGRRMEDQDSWLRRGDLHVELHLLQMCAQHDGDGDHIEVFDSSKSNL